MKLLNRFVLCFEPPTVTAQEAKIVVRDGKPHKYNPPALADAKEKYIAYLSEHKPDQPYDGPIALYVEWYFHSESQSGYKITRPDTDNLDKLLKDCMTVAGFWKDDAQVCQENIRKKWAYKEPGGIVITICKIEVDDL